MAGAEQALNTNTDKAGQFGHPGWPEGGRHENSPARDSSELSVLNTVAPLRALRPGKTMKRMNLSLTAFTLVLHFCRGAPALRTLTFRVHSLQVLCPLCASDSLERSALSLCVSP